MTSFEAILDFLIHRPIIMMGLMSIPLLLAWRFKKAFPSYQLLRLSLIPLASSAIIVFAPSLVLLPGILFAILVAVATIDLFLLVAARHFRVTRSVIKIASLGKKHDCLFTVANHSLSTCLAEIRDDIPNEFVPDIEKFEHTFSAQSRSSFEYQFVANERGRFRISCVYLKILSRFRLWHGYYDVECDDEVFVYPDMKQISQYDLLARTDRLSLMGVRRSRKIGQDNEFERLRDYTIDDNFKHIDWRTSARRQKLTVKDYQENQSQRIVFLVDCGRMMTGTSKGMDQFDHALNAMLMLSYVALRQGDSVGLICFSDAIHSYTPPRAGVNHINRLLHASFDQRANYVESRYDEAFLYLRKNCLKRSLVVLITNVIDSFNAEQILQYMSHLTTRHLPLGVLLRDHQMFDVIENHLERPAPVGSDLYFSAAAAAKIVNWRQQVVADLQHQGAMALDVFPEQLTAGLVNSYLQIKAKHLL